MINQIFNEDCLVGMQRIPDKSIDLILCDLPYGTTACKWDVIIPFAPLWEQYERVIKDNGAIVLTASQPFTSALVMSNLKMFRYSWIWQKEMGTGFGNANKQPLRDAEDILVFYKRQPLYVPQKTKGAPYKTMSKGGNNAGQVYQFGGLNSISTVNTGDRFPTQVIKFSRDRDKSHPTQKPVALFEYLIKTYTNEGETVLDNCMGSGTTAIACINTNRNYIGFEKEEKYFIISNERISKHNNIPKQTSIFT